MTSTSQITPAELEHVLDNLEDTPAFRDVDLEFDAASRAEVDEIKDRLTALPSPVKISVKRVTLFGLMTCELAGEPADVLDALTEINGKHAPVTETAVAALATLRFSFPRPGVTGIDAVTKAIEEMTG